MSETISNTTNVTDTMKRAVLVAGLRALADDLEKSTAPLPTHVPRAEWLLFNREDQRGTATQVVKSIDGPWEKGKSLSRGRLFDYTKDYGGGIKAEVVVEREAVCERIVVGTETIEHPAVEAKPARTETVEVIEWKCLPLLTDEKVPA